MARRRDRAAGDKGVLRFKTTGGISCSVDEVLRVVQACRHVDTHGEACPAGWTPGARTLIGKPRESKAYFAAVAEEAAAADEAQGKGLPPALKKQRV
jgi:hypothetical protein